MLATEARSRRKLVGNPSPRLAPPLPAITKIDRYLEIADRIGISPYPWQERVARYLTAVGPDDTWLYREVATLAARQNGKTEIMVPLIIGRLLDGHRIVHAAQSRELSREMHERIADVMTTHYPELLRKPRGVTFGAGMESVKLANGGRLKIVASNRGGARGASSDLLIIDEVLELDDNSFISAAKPTTIARPQGQVVYFSNAGTSTSVVLNSLRDRADNDPDLAYLEWSAGPGLAVDDVDGWLQANPAIGHNPVLLGNLEGYYRGYLLGQQLDIWEREHLCRQTVTRAQPMVSPEDWQRQEFVGALLHQKRPTMGIKMDVSGERVSAVLAWRESDARIGLDVIADVVDYPVDVPEMAERLIELARQKHVINIVFDPYTDADLARHLPRAKPMIGRDYANASERFVRLVSARELRVHDPDDTIAKDLVVTIKRHGANSSYIAIKASPEVTNTAVEAAIRAIWDPTQPRPSGRAQVY